jgi:hypothetical protein
MILPGFMQPTGDARRSFRRTSMLTLPALGRPAVDRPVAALVLFTLLALGRAIGFTAALADDQPAGTDTIESLTPEQARALVEEWPGIQYRKKLKGSEHGLGDCLPLNALKTLDPATVQALAGWKGALFLDGLTTLDADTAGALVGFRGERILLQEKVEKKVQPLRLKLFPEPLTPENPLTPETALIFKSGTFARLTALESPDSVEIASALASREGPLPLPNLKKISPKTLTALLQKADVEIPPHRDAGADSAAGWKPDRRFRNSGGILAAGGAREASFLALKTLEMP